MLANLSLFCVAAALIFQLTVQQRGDCGCVKRENCPAFVNAVKSGKTPPNLPICGFGSYPFTPNVKCPCSRGRRSADENTSEKPSASNLSPVEVVKKRCQKYAKLVFAEEKTSSGNLEKDLCVRKDASLLLDGRSLPGQHPYIALLSRANDDVTRYICLANLLSERYLVTQAHCVSDRIRDVQPKDFLITLGQVSEDKRNRTYSAVYNVEQVILHPLYRKDQFYNDIALIKLKDPVSFNQFVRPACLYTETFDVKKPLNLLSFGLRNRESAGAVHLKLVPASLEDENSCRTSLKDMEKIFPSGFDSNSSFCMYSQERDTFEIESGDPLEVNAKELYCMNNIVGMASLNVKSSHNDPSQRTVVFTKFSNYFQWIVENVWNQETPQLESHFIASSSSQIL